MLDRSRFRRTPLFDDEFWWSLLPRLLVAAEALHLELSSDIAEQWAERRAETTSGFELYLLGR